jgi:hypothetical protein
MPSRNQRCPCGSGIKYKRCCLVGLEAVARELGDRDAFLDGLIAWLRSEHRHDIEEAGSHTALIRMLRGITGRNMSMVWAINDYRPTDGGPPLICRYAARSELSEVERAIARGLADARLDAYRVRSLAAGVWLELESLADGTSVRVAWRDGLEQLDLGEVLLARVVRATSRPTLWGLGARFPAGGERRWRARLVTLPNDPAHAALALLEFHPDERRRAAARHGRAASGHVVDHQRRGRARRARARGPLARSRARSTSAAGGSGRGRSRQHG